MQRRAVGGRWGVTLAVALVLVLLLWNNLLVPRLPRHGASYVIANVAATAVLLAVARTAGLSWAELGLTRSQLPVGAACGAICFVLVAAAYAAALAVPSVRPLLTDARVADLGTAEVAYRALVRILLGTVLWEEVAFRGVLLAALARVLPLRTAVVVNAVVFGLWHVRPTRTAVITNDLVDGPLALALVVLLACAAAAVAGLVLAWLRLRTGSLLAPALLHLATSSLGIVAATAAFRLA